MSKISNITERIENYEKYIIKEKCTTVFFSSTHLVIDINKHKEELLPIVLNAIGQEKVSFEYYEGYTKDNELDHIKIQIDINSTI